MPMLKKIIRMLRSAPTRVKAVLAASILVGLITSVVGYPALAEALRPGGGGSSLAPSLWVIGGTTVQTSNSLYDLQMPSKTVFGSASSDGPGTNGQVYYNTATGKFRCYQSSAWTDCVTSGSTNNLQQSFNAATSTTELTVNSTQGALTISDTLGDRIGNLFEVQDLTNPATGSYSQKYFTQSSTATTIGTGKLLGRGTTLMDMGLGLTNGFLVTATGGFYLNSSNAIFGNNLGSMFIDAFSNGADTTVTVQNSSGFVANLSVEGYGAVGTSFYLKGDVVTTNTNYTVSSTDTVVIMRGTVARTVTLPACAAGDVGRKLYIDDGGQVAATANITVNRAGSDTIDGGTSKVINTNSGALQLICAAATNWYSL